MANTQTYNYAKFDYPNAPGLTTAFGINDRGELVGEYIATTTGSSPTVPFPIFETLRGVYVFNDTGFSSKGAELIKSSFGFRPGTIVDAYAINNNGDTPIASQDFKFGRLIDQSIVYGINDQRSFVGLLSDGSPGDVFSRYHYSYGVKDVNGIFSSISVFGSIETIPRDINNEGEIAGYYTDASGHTHGFIGNHQTFSTIDFPGASNTKIYGLNDLGQVVGSYNDLAGQHSFVDTNGIFVTLKDEFQAYGINNFGQISGTYTDQAGTHASVATLQGPDTLTLRVSEDRSGDFADAQLIIKVDGVIFGGIQTVTALRSSGKPQDITLTGDFENTRSIDVSFINDQYDYKDGADVNLYVDELEINGNKYDGSTASVGSFRSLKTGSSTELLNNGTAHFAVEPDPLPIRVDTLTLHVSEDRWVYHPDAQFIVTVDGHQVGDVHTVTALHGAGQTQDVTVTGDFSNAHKVAVQFLNDQYGGPNQDVNLYVDSFDFNGVRHSGSEGAGNASVGSQAGSSYELFRSGTVSLGAAPDTLTLHVSEDRWVYHPDAQFIVTVDGHQIGDVHTVTALHSAGQTQDVTVTGNFSGAHKVAVQFLNDQYGGPNQDVNLYVESLEFNGAHQSGSHGTADLNAGSQVGSSFELIRNGALSFDVALSTLSLQVSEDAYLGDAQFIVIVDNRAVGGIQTVTASHALGQSQTISLQGHFDGAQEVAVQFINDKFDGAGKDRNLYIDSVNVNGNTVAGHDATVHVGDGQTLHSAELWKNTIASFDVSGAHHDTLLV